MQDSRKDHLIVSIIIIIKEGSETGTIICAGTGSGKTKAFYVPAFLGIVNEIHLKPFVKVYISKKCTFG